MDFMDFQSMADSIQAFIRDNREWAAPVVFILAFGESIAIISLVLPFWVMLISIGTLIGASGTMVDFWTVLIAASLGAAAGDWVSYWLGEHYHEEIARIWPLSRHPDLIPKGHVFFEKYGIWAIFIGRFFGPLRAAVPLVAGIVQMPKVPFQIANVLSAFIWAAVLLAPGSFGLAWFMGR